MSSSTAGWRGEEPSTPLQRRGGCSFEDYPAGLTISAGPVTVDASEIMDFARRFDPQPMHVDPDFATTGPFKGLIASGWHTASLTMRLLVESFLPAAASLSSPGIDELRWLKPVRPGDSLSIRVTVLESVPSRSKPDRGMVRSKVEVSNQRDEVVMTLMALNLIRREAATGAPDVRPVVRGAS